SPRRSTRIWLCLACAGSRTSARRPSCPFRLPNAPAIRRPDMPASIVAMNAPSSTATLEQQNHDLFAPPETDHGLLPNLKFSFAHAHTRRQHGGWAREVTRRE